MKSNIFQVAFACVPLAELQVMDAMGTLFYKKPYALAEHCSSQFIFGKLICPLEVKWLVPSMVRDIYASFAHKIICL